MESLNSGRRDEVVEKQKGDFECLYCGTYTAFRSHRKNIIELLRSRITSRLPFRCFRCHRRFWSAVDRRDL